MFSVLGYSRLGYPNLKLAPSSSAEDVLERAKELREQMEARPRESPDGETNKLLEELRDKVDKQEETSTVLLEVVNLLIGLVKSLAGGEV